MEILGVSWSCSHCSAEGDARVGSVRGACDRRERRVGESEG
jgi:hypothetical protein